MVISACTRMIRSSAFFIVLALLCSSANAVVKNDRTVETLENTAADRPVVLIMRPDIAYHLLTLNGISELHEEWTIAARKNFITAVEGFASDRNVDLVIMDPNEDLTDEERAYDKLHYAVGQTVVALHLNNKRLLTKNEQMIWTLGPGISFMADKYHADYALFSYYRDMEHSGGKIAADIFKAALFGAGAATPETESGFATLVDLRTGNVVWANSVLIGSGELRDEDKARATVDDLFANLPE
jgi:hypothetical protein